MRFTDKQWVPTSPVATWTALHDPDILRRCIAGCEKIERITETEYAITLRTSVNGRPSRVSGKILLSDQERPHRCQVAFEGSGEHASLTIGHINIQLEEGSHGGTRITYMLHAAAGGALARMGDSSLKQYATKRADIFFSRFADQLVAQRAQQPQPIPADGPSSGSGWQTPLSWLMVAGTLVLIALYYLYAR